MTADQPYTIPPGNRLGRFLLRPALRWLMQALSRITITGRENVPTAGPYLIAINHVSLYEAPLMLCFWPVLPETLGASDVWHRSGQGLLAHVYGGIPVHRGVYDRQAMSRSLAALRSGRPLLVAPEGHRSHIPGMNRARPGLAYLIDEACVPVVPVGVVGTTDDFLRRAFSFKWPALEMHIGRPMQLPPLEGRGEARRRARQRNVDLIMLEIAGLLPPEYRGVYADPAILDRPSAEEPN